jgi:phosphotransferase system, enzyme I, PtsP
VASLRVPLQILGGSPRLDAALRIAAGTNPDSSASSSLNYLCAQIAVACAAPVASVYVLEENDELVLRGNFGFSDAVLGEVRLKVGQGITGTAFETMRPVTVDDAGLVAQFAYFPQLAEERYPAFLAIPLRAASRPRGALVLQREVGPFTPEDALVAVVSGRAVAGVLESMHGVGSNVSLRGSGNRRGRTLGVGHVLSRALPRRRSSPDEGRRDLFAAFAAEREELRALIDRARTLAAAPVRELEEVATVIEDARLQERAGEHLERGMMPSLALERIAAEFSRALVGHGPHARRAVDVEAFLGAVAYRYAGLEPDRVRRGEVIVCVQLSALAALRGWANGATAALCAREERESSGVAVLTALGLPVATDLPRLFEVVGNGTRVALDGDTGEVIVNPSAAQAAPFRAPK